jgi:hypothetical protein
LTLDHVPKRFCASKRIVRPGQVDGVCMYFRATFADDIAFSTGPEGTKTHWPMLLYRTAARVYRVGESFTMQVEAPDLSEPHDWSWRIGSLSSQFFER